jgi:uncharacterized NTF2-like protein DUF6841
MGASKRGALMSVVAAAFPQHSSTKDSGQTDALETLNDYYGAFGALDEERVNACYDVPVMFICNDGTFAAITSAESAAWLAKQFDLLKPKAFARNKITKLRIKQTKDGLAIASGIDVRYDNAGKEIAKSGITYLLRKNAGKWKICVLAFHDMI